MSEYKFAVESVRSDGSVRHSTFITESWEDVLRRIPKKDRDVLSIRRIDDGSRLAKAANVTCPICGGHVQAITMDGKRVIHCADPECGSNGGNNFSEIMRRQMQFLVSENRS